MLKLYVPEFYPHVRTIPLLAPARADDERLFQHLPFSEYVDIFESTLSIEEADAVLLPHYLTDLARRPEYLTRVKQYAMTHAKKVIVFTTQDDPAPISDSNAVYIRPSAYASTLTDYEFVSPGLVEDLGRQYGFAPLGKGVRPRIGFVGKANISSWKTIARHVYKNYILYSGAQREGLYFRRRAMRVLERNPHIQTSFITRKQFGAHRRTLELPLEQARKEYVTNIQESLFTLAPRGDGNYSLRFYETLSLGRIPVLIDTDMRLPLENIVPYESCIVRVPYTDVGHIDRILLEFWNSASEDDLLRMQHNARTVYERYLHYPIFLRTLLSSEDFMNSLHHHGQVS